MINCPPNYRLWNYNEKVMYEVKAITWCSRKIIGIDVVDDDYGHSYDFTSNDKFSLMLDTGCKDKNGNFIYEFDVLKFVTPSEKYYSLVYFKPEILRYVGCRIQFPRQYSYNEDIVLTEKEIINGELIGNIFEDKELRRMFEEFEDVAKLLNFAT